MKAATQTRFSAHYVIPNFIPNTELYTEYQQHVFRHQKVGSDNLFNSPALSFRYWTSFIFQFEKYESYKGMADELSKADQFMYQVIWRNSHCLNIKGVIDVTFLSSVSPNSLTVCPPSSLQAQSIFLENITTFHPGIWAAYFQLLQICFQQLTRVPGYHDRLKAMVFKANFSEKVEEVKHQLSCVRTASVQLQDSKRLARVLEVRRTFFLLIHSCTVLFMRGNGRRKCNVLNRFAF